MSSEFVRGVRKAETMIRARGVDAARKFFDVYNTGDEFDRGFESVLSKAEARQTQPLIAELLAAMAADIVAELRVKYAPSEEAFADKRAAVERLEKAKQALVKELK